MEVYSFDSLEYWASLEDPLEFADEALERVISFQNSLRASSLSARRERNIRYYYNDYYPESIDSGTMEIKPIGEEGEYAGLVANHFRNLLNHLLTLTTQYRPSWDTRAINSDFESLVQARLGNNILEYYMTHKRVERLLKAAVEHSLLLQSGFVCVEWNPDAGKITEADPERGDIFREGDLRFTNPTLLDVAWDYRVSDWNQLPWTAVRETHNKWDLAARFPEYRNEILAQDDSRGYLRRENYGGTDTQPGGSDTDLVGAWKFFHPPSDALPEGRYALILDDATALLDLPYPYGEEQPLKRVTGGEIVGSCLGYTIAFDLQGPQEALNSEISTICTNHKSFGVQNIWSPGGQVRARQLEGGLNLIESDEMPQPLNLTATPPEIFEFSDKLMQHMEYLSGINSVARGQPEANLKSGAALALIDAKAIQFASGLVHSYQMLLEDVGTTGLRFLRTFADSERVISIQGKHNRTYQHFFTARDLERIDRVAVSSGNALTRTTSGRVEIATHLLDKGMIRTPEEYLNVLETGNLDVMLEGERSQLDLVRSENEALMDGGTVSMLVTDYHLLHMQEHQALLNSPEIRADQARATNVLAHMMSHVQALQDPFVLQMQLAFGFRVPESFMAMAGAPPPPGAGPPPAIGPASVPPPGQIGPGPEEAPMPPEYSNPVGVEGPNMPQMPKVPEVANAA